MPTRKNYRSTRKNFTRKSVSRKRKSPRTVAQVARSGLNKLEKKQVSAIVQKNAESKYFKTTLFGSPQGFKLQTNVADESVIEVMGLAVGKHEQEQLTGTYGYSSSGGAAATNLSLNMYRTFWKPDINTEVDPPTTTGGDIQKYRSFIPDGRVVSPSFNQTKIRIYRESVNTNSDDKAKMANGYFYRVIRVKPKKNRFTDVDFDPNLDLFLDNYGEAYGIYSGGDAYVPQFQRFELMTSKINNRRYEVMDDINFTLMPPTTTSNGWEGSGTFNGRLVSDSSKGSDKIITFNHKANKRLYYDGKYELISSCQPLAGNSEELIFIHACMIGDDAPNINLQHKVEIKCVSTFKDI